MKKQAMDNLEILRLAAILLLLIFLCFVYGTPGQTPKKCDHISDSFERFEGHMRLTIPVKITYFDGVKIEGVAESGTDKTIKPKEFFIDDQSIVLDDFRKNYKKGKWWFLYCDIDNHVYIVEKQLPDQLRKEPKL